MRVKSVLLASVFAAAAVATTGARAQVKEVEMVHWWTSGGEAAALNVLKEQSRRRRAMPGRTSRSPAAAATQAMTALTAHGHRRQLSRPPSQMLGFDSPRLGRAGRARATSPTIAKKEGWDKVVPAPLQKFSKYNGKWIAAPVNVHSSNWIWVNKAVMDKIGGKPPKTLDELIVVLDKAKAAGVIPLAHGGQDWQEATMFDSVVLIDRRRRLLQEGDERPRPGGAYLRRR